MSIANVRQKVTEALGEYRGLGITESAASGIEPALKTACKLLIDIEILFATDDLAALKSDVNKKKAEISSLELLIADLESAKITL